jgi:hypothetical protein
VDAAALYNIKYTNKTQAPTHDKEQYKHQYKHAKYINITNNIITRPSPHHQQHQHPDHQRHPSAPPSNAASTGIINHITISLINDVARRLHQRRPSPASSTPSFTCINKDITIPFIPRRPAGRVRPALVHHVHLVAQAPEAGSSATTPANGHALDTNTPITILIPA